MMATNVRPKEKCQGCSKNILIHNKIALCHSCSKIVHAKCAYKLFNFDHLSDTWSCWECKSTAHKRYNPFESIQYDKHLQDDSEALEELNQISKFLTDCKTYDHKMINDNFEQF